MHYLGKNRELFKAWCVLEITIQVEHMRPTPLILGSVRIFTDKYTDSSVNIMLIPRLYHPRNFQN